ncbi:MAG: hypothetical protein ABIT37_14205 [Luteolibacter sp.]
MRFFNRLLDGPAFRMGLMNDDCGLLISDWMIRWRRSPGTRVADSSENQKSKFLNRQSNLPATFSYTQPKPPPPSKKPSCINGISKPSTGMSKNSRYTGGKRKSPAAAASDGSRPSSAFLCSDGMRLSTDSRSLALSEGAGFHRHLPATTPIPALPATPGNGMQDQGLTKTVNQRGAMHDCLPMRFRWNKRFPLTIEGS